jgi:tetratricopeptide (TPR) repeat protein
MGNRTSKNRRPWTDLPNWVAVLGAIASLGGAVIVWWSDVAAQRERASAYVASAKDLLRQSFSYPPVFGEPEGVNPQLILRRAQAGERLHLALEMDPLASLASRAHRLLGIMFIQEKEFGRARSELQKAIQLNPKSADGYSDIGLVSFAENPPTVGQTAKSRLRSAEEAYSKALELDPRSVDALNGQAAVYVAMGQFSKAQNDIEKAIGVDRQDADSRFDLGQLLAAEGHFVQAEREIEESTKLNPSRMPGGTNWIGYITLARLHQQNGDSMGEAQEYRAALNIRPRNPETMAAFAIAIAHEAFEQDGDQRAKYRQTANREFLLALRGRPTSWMIQEAYGLFLLQEGYCRRANSRLATAIALQPHDPDAPYYSELIKRCVARNARRVSDRVGRTVSEWRSPSRQSAGVRAAST